MMCQLLVLQSWTTISWKRSKSVCWWNRPIWRISLLTRRLYRYSYRCSKMIYGLTFRISRTYYWRDVVQWSSLSYDAQSKLYKSLSRICKKYSWWIWWSIYGSNSLWINNIITIIPLRWDFFVKQNNSSIEWTLNDLLDFVMRKNILSNLFIFMSSYEAICLWLCPVSFVSHSKNGKNDEDNSTVKMIFFWRSRNNASQTYPRQLSQW